MCWIVGEFFVCDVWVVFEFVGGFDDIDLWLVVVFGYFCG